jgi:hypothetical protein
MMRITGKGSLLNKLLRAGKDPISARARSLNTRARELKAEIRRLKKQSSQEPKFQRTTSLLSRRSDDRSDRSSMGALFETVEHDDLRVVEEIRDPEAHYNALGVRKLDPMAWVRGRVGGKPEVQRKSVTEKPKPQKLAQYMAVGGVQGIEPLRREKRIARNRFLMMFVLFLLILCGVFAVMRP